jgi:sugar (pentulose or hexulose) kinase
LNHQTVSLIFDIGKTTKKVLLFNEDFHVLEEQTQNFAEVPDEDGFPSEDLGLVIAWTNEMIHHYLQHPHFLVTHINFSAYGASLVHLNEKGNPHGTFYNYLKPIPETCKEEFLKRYNKNGDLGTLTTSPFLGLLNSGLQLFWLKHYKPEVFRHIHTSLHFPQFFTHLLTRRKFADITSIGCHTMLWDFQKENYHDWVEKENIQKLFPDVHPADYTFDYFYDGRSIKVGVGVHDSSAALMPYLVVMKEKFLLLSTGTWNICFNPFNHDFLTPHELSQDCLCYLTFDGKPVKASRIFLGHEHELQQQEMASYFKVDKEYYKTIDYNEEVYNKLEQRSAGRFHPLGMEGTGPILNHTIPKTDYDAFKDFEDAQYQLIRQLVQWQKVSIDLIDPGYEVKNIIVVGGFTKSKLFLKIMKAELKERNILISDHPRAAALGAAWLVSGEKGYLGKDSLLNVISV